MIFADRSKAVLLLWNIFFTLCFMFVFDMLSCLLIAALPRFSLLLKDPGFFFRLFRGCTSCRCFCVKLVKLLPVHRYSVDIFHILVLQEYWALSKREIPLKRVLGGVRIVVLSISSHEQTQ